MVLDLQIAGADQIATRFGRIVIALWLHDGHDCFGEPLHNFPDHAFLAGSAAVDFSSQAFVPSSTSPRTSRATRA
jgi:hypothetical protein